MKSLRTVRYSMLAAAVATAAAVSTPAVAEVSANASVASAYLWRGQPHAVGVVHRFPHIGDQLLQSGIIAVYRLPFFFKYRLTISINRQNHDSIYLLLSM